MTTDDNAMVLYDTLSGKKQNPVKNDNSVSIYLCGVTVYDDAHIGHARTIIAFDVLRRHLENDLRIKVKMIQNFTDVDDKIITRALAEKISASELSGRYIERYHAEFDALHVARADAYPKATEHIADIVSFIAALIDKNAAYVSENGVYFAVSAFSKYGRLSKKKIDELRSGARIQVDETKRDSLDFALWKFDNDDPSWDSPWGRGRPGWHIECSAMSTKYLGDTIDIHGGGRDLIFPHHENEIAQSESRTCCEFARIWMHVGMVTIQGEKMSKSLGNIRSIRQALDDWGANVIRLFCLSGHYSKPIDYSKENLQESLVRWRQIEACYFELWHATKFSIDGDGNGSSSDDSSGSSPAAAAAADSASLHSDLAKTRQMFYDALNDDLNTHLALSALMRIVSEVNSKVAEYTLDAKWAKNAMSILTTMSDVMGLTLCKMGKDESLRIEDALVRRNAFRRESQYEKADAIRDSLLAESIEILDRREGDTIWIKREKIGKDKR